MKNFFIKLAPLVSILFLSACASTPTSVKLSPQLDNNNQVEIASDHTWKLSSDDFRTARYLISISSGDDVAQLINEAESSRIIIENALHKQWQKQGIQFTQQQDNPYQLRVQLIKVLTEVEQNTVNYESDSNIVIKVQVQSDETLFSKTFRAHNEEKAPLRTSVNTLTEKLNTQLSQLLQQIVQDEELNAKMSQL